MKNSDMPAMPPHAESTLDSYMGLTKREHAAIEFAKAMISNGDHLQTSAGLDFHTERDISLAAISMANCFFDTLAELEK